MTASAARPRYAYLGPAGTFTEAALRQVVSDTEAEYLPQTDVTSAIEAVRSGVADHAVVAIESTGEGGVTATLDALAVGSPLVVQREMLVPVAFTLVARPGIALSDVRRISAHPHAWVQCRRWLAEHLPDATHVPATSNTAPAALIAQDPEGAGALGFDAALVPPPAVAHYGLDVLADGVADNPDAVTRFVLLGRPGVVPEPTGADKTTLVVHLPSNEAGALLAMLDQLATRGVNLSRIESRPIGDELGRYSFSLDIEGHVAEPRVAEALMGLHRTCPHVRFLGSYPRADHKPNEVARGTGGEAYDGAMAWVRAVRAGEAF
ncbi:prephenate dehydratase [Cellulomonas sp. NPDC089187]|uniref:prephenate dehydratase n=1 Tax=Cellulomonas sp. NPDC089187 TaxID=3154970 RepID=UPI0034165078